MRSLREHLNQVSLEDASLTPETEVQNDTWIDLPETQLGDLKDGMVAQDALEAMADKVEATEDTPSLEAYEWSFRTLTELQGIAPQKQVSLESFDTPESQRTGLATAVREHAGRLGRAINVALEDYTETFGQSLKNTIGNISNSSKELGQEVSKVSGVPDMPVKVDHKRIWNMLHIEGKLPSSLSELSQKEISAVKDMVALASRAVSDIRQGKDATSAFGASRSVKLMFNTTVSFSGSGIDVDTHSVPQPKIEKGTAHKKSRAALGFMIGLFIPLPFTAILGAGLGYASGVKAEERRAVDESVTERDVADAKKALNDFAGLSSTTDELERLAEELAKIVEAAEDKADVRRKAAPVLELIGFIAKHIAEVQYGAVIMAKALAKAPVA